MKISEEKIIKRFTAISGIICAILYAITAVLFADAPQINISGNDIAAWITHNRSILLFGVYIWGLSISSTFCFLVGLWKILKQKSAISEMLATLGLAAGFSIFTIAYTGFNFILVAIYRVHTLDQSFLKLLYDLTYLSVTFTGFATAVSIGAFSLLILYTGIMKKWLAWFGLFIAGIHLISAGAYAGSGLLSPSGLGVYVAPVLYYIWIIAVSFYVLLGSVVN